MDADDLREAPLKPYRVLDLTRENGFLCGKTLADLGADVVKIEPPQGDPGRSIGPFYRDEVNPERSLYWFSFNLNKRSITLNMEIEDGREILKRLVERADFLIESFPPGHMDELGLGYEDLREINGRLIMISISPFGQSGPYAHFKGPDIVNMAMGGQMHLCGNEDNPPVRISHPQSYLHAAMEGAGGGLIALYYRESNGVGQHVDVSAQQSVIWTLMDATAYWNLNKLNLHRSGQYYLRATSSGETRFRILWPCKDGFVSFFLMADPSTIPGILQMVDWMEEEGIDVSYLKSVDWNALNYDTLTEEEYERMGVPFLEFLSCHTKKELYEGAVKRRIILYPESTTADLLENPQLKAREYFQRVEHPELQDSLLYPGAFIKMSETPCQVKRRPPLIGEHNDEVYLGELGLSSKEMAQLKARGII